MILVQSKSQLSKYKQIKNNIKNVFEFKTEKNKHYNVISKLSTITLD